VLIERALRDEGTSHHYLPPAPFAEMHEPALITRVAARLAAEAPGDRGAARRHLDHGCARPA
jgi:hypothetical protein